MRNKPVVMLLVIGMLLTVSLAPITVAQEAEEATSESMTRIMMLPPDAEVTGMHINAQGQFFVNAMHPDEQYYQATVGVINGVDWNSAPATVPELPSSSSESDIWHGIRTRTATIKCSSKAAMCLLKEVSQEESTLLMMANSSLSVRNQTTMPSFH